MKKTRLLTREYLQLLGIKDVFEDGTIIGAKGNPISPGDNGKGYKMMGFTKSGKHLNLYVHNVVWAWFNGTLAPDLDVHHVDGNRGNNALSNLMVLKHADHLKLHATSTREMKCSMKKPRSFYEAMLARYEALWEAANQANNAKEDGKQRANICNTRARLRYWDNHQEEYFEYVKQTKLAKRCKNAKKQQLKDRKVLQHYRRYFRENGNRKMWHQVCDILNRWDSLTSKQKKHIFEVLKENFPLEY